MAYRGCGYMDSRAVLRLPQTLGHYHGNLSMAEKPDFPVLRSD